MAAAVVAAAGAAVAFTLPSMAGTAPSAGKAASAKSDVAPQILAAMARDLGVDSDQAAARLKRSAWASGVSAKLRAQTGADFGGAWLATDGTTLKIAVTDSGSVAAVKQAGAVPVLVKRSEQALVSAKEKLDAADAGKRITGWYVDVATNKVVVVATPGAADAARQWATNAGVKSDAVTVKTSSARPKTLADIRGADAYFIAVDGGTARCSVGFSVEGGFVTAGHCGAVGDKTFANAQGTAQGTVAASVFPGNADMGFVKVGAGFTPRAVVNDFEGNELPVAGSTEAPVGAAICRSGSTTGTRCGSILAKNQTVVYPEGQVTGLTRTNVCAEGGDSGGPWLSGDQAQGVTSGGSGDCTVGGETFFQPVNEILATDNLTLVTQEGSGAGGGEATDSAESAGDCTDQQVARTGDIQAGAAQAQPNGGAFRANAGRQTACLDAPAGADFDLALQRLTDRGFRTVAEATGNGDKTLSANVRSGTYRYVVVASAGAGAYTLGFSAP
ncbi:alpha-lytic protease prodomain-containing protein [Paractinoplanes ferrugineus]|uniref:Serine protease n=1 Tax=Paractinoplanes ferrugineus TaxID=113564 RepID=A0A919ME62_9ACTN|nr:serine protease [Actinoplanes ferrugineus]